jgi:outer membrane receptor protein involved in Fe transport
VQEVIVTATKRPEKLQSVPGSVSAVGSDLISRVQANNLTDVAAYVPGLNVQSAGVDANRLVIRGLSTGPNDLSPSVGVYVDDAPFGSNSGLALGALFSPDVDPNDLDHIEVLRGPQGTLYGANTLGGLVKYVTKAPDAENYSGHIRVDWGDESDTGAESYGFRAGANIPIIKDKVALRVSGFYVHNDGDLTDVRTGRKGLNTTTKEGGMIDLMLRPTDALKVDVIAMTDFSNTPHVGVVDGNAQTLQPIYGQYAGFNYVDGFAKSNYQVYQGNIVYTLPDGISITSSTSYSIFKVNELADDTTVFATAFGPFLGPLFEFSGAVTPTTRKVTEEFRIASPSNNKFEWLAGFFYDHENSDYFSNVTSTYLYGATPPAFLVPTVDALANYETVNLIERYVEVAGFANATYYILPNLDVGAGVRFSHNDQHIENQGSGLLAEEGAIPALAFATSSDSVWTESFDARWRFVPGSMLYGRIARGYRPGGPNIGGNSFQPDTTWNFEAGVKSTALDGKLTADLTLFLIDWNNIQLNFFNGTNTIIGNAGNARSEGVEFEGSYAPIRGLVLSANVAYTDAYITSLIPGATGGAAVGNELPFSSRWAGAVRGDYTFPLTPGLDGTVGASLRFKSAFNTTFPRDTGTRFYRLPNTAFVDLRAGVIFHKTWSLNLQVLNIADERKLQGAEEFLAVPAAVADAEGQPAFLTYTPGRTFGVSLNATF